MKLGIICESMKDQYGPVAFESVEKLGLDFIEVCCNFDPDTENFINAVPETKKLLASSPVTIASVGRWNLKANQGGVIVPSELDKNIRLMNAAAEVGDDVAEPAVVADEFQHACCQERDDDELAHATHARAQRTKPVEYADGADAQPHNARGDNTQKQHNSHI